MISNISLFILDLRRLFYRLLQEQHNIEVILLLVHTLPTDLMLASTKITDVVLS